MFSEKLAALRREKGMTQADMAQHLTVTQSAYSQWESGKCEVDFATLCALADFFHVTTDYLLDRTNTTNTPYTKEELELISQYRGLNKRGKDAVKNCMQFEFSQRTKPPAPKGRSEKTAM